MKPYLQPNQVAQVVLLLHNGTSICSVARRFAVTQRELCRALEGHQLTSRTSICSFVRGGTGGALPEPYQMTSSRLLVCMFLTKLSETDFMRVA